MARKIFRPAIRWLSSAASASPTPMRSGVLMTTKMIVFQMLFQNLGNRKLEGSNSCWYQRSPTNGPSRRAVESWRLIQIPRKNGKRIITAKIAKCGRMNRYGVIGFSPIRRLRTPEPQTKRLRNPPTPFLPLGVAVARELIFGPLAVDLPGRLATKDGWGRPCGRPHQDAIRLEAVALLVLEQDLRLRGRKLVEDLLRVAATDDQRGGLAGPLGTEEDVATAREGRQELHRLGERCHLGDQGQEAFARCILELIGLAHLVACRDLPRRAPVERVLAEPVDEVVGACLGVLVLRAGGGQGQVVRATPGSVTEDGRDGGNTEILAEGVVVAGGLPDSRHDHTVLALLERVDLGVALDNRSVEIAGQVGDVLGRLNAGLAVERDLAEVFVRPFTTALIEERRELDPGQEISARAAADDLIAAGVGVLADGRDCLFERLAVGRRALGIEAGLLEEGLVVVQVHGVGVDRNPDPLTLPLTGIPDRFGEHVGAIATLLREVVDRNDDAVLDVTRKRVVPGRDDVRKLVRRGGSLELGGILAADLGLDRDLAFGGGAVKVAHDLLEEVAIRPGERVPERQLDVLAGELEGAGLATVSTRGRRLAAGRGFGLAGGLALALVTASAGGEYKRHGGHDGEESHAACAAETGRGRHVEEAWVHLSSSCGAPSAWAAADCLAGLANVGCGHATRAGCLAPVYRFLGPVA